MMKKCWEMEPDKRPSFKELHTLTSNYIEQIAGYLDLGFNPFAGDTSRNVKEKGDVNDVVQSDESAKGVTSASEQVSVK